ncbi:Rib/alpha-like domain-containing protein [Corynebacterium sp. NML130628]|uniref:Rib/alpha-like domain-containing protein n=1 Tax=Corynebacterium sp. NML130628 TaxID=1906333 RepID=UPI0008FB9F5C|nr:Rib/alpha-like domain-containing protein [Corynebacterium sp. NML130628]OIR42849.1 hypothetical protein BJP07_08085 [Corynebacterium sp. NML130628]
MRVHAQHLGPEVIQEHAVDTSNGLGFEELPAGKAKRSYLFLDTDGSPLANTEVRFVSQDGKTSHVGRTNENGAVAFIVDPGSYRYQIYGGRETGKPRFVSQWITVKEDTFIITSLKLPAEQTIFYTWPRIDLKPGEHKVVTPNEGNETGTEFEKIGGTPEWVTVYRDGTVEVSPLETTKPGVYTVKIRASNAPDFAVRIELQDAATGADRYTFTYPTSYVRPGSVGSSFKPILTLRKDGYDFVNQPVPPGTTFETSSSEATIDKNTGEVKYVAPRNAKVGGEPAKIPVAITMPDGSRLETEATFEVIPPLLKTVAQLSYDEARVAPRGKFVADLNVKGKLPVGTEFRWDARKNEDLRGWNVAVDSTTGTVEAVVPEGVEEEYNLHILASYTDGSREYVTLPVRIVERLSSEELEAHKLRYTQQIVTPGKAFTADPVGKPVYGSVFSIENDGGISITIDRTTGRITAKIPADTEADSTYTARLRVDFPGGHQIIELKATANSLARTNTVNYAVREGFAKPKDQYSGARYGLPKSYKNHDAKVEINPETGEVRATVPRSQKPKEINVPVVVTWEDGSQQLVDLHVVPKQTASKKELTWERVWWIVPFMIAAEGFGILLFWIWDSNKHVAPFTVMTNALKNAGFNVSG